MFGAPLGAACRPEPLLLDLEEAMVAACTACFRRPADKALAAGTSETESSQRVGTLLRLSLRRLSRYDDDDDDDDDDDGHDDPDDDFDETVELPHDDCSVITLVHYYGDIRDGWRGVKGEWKGESGGRQAVEPLWGGRRKGEGSMDGDAREGKGGVTWVPKRSRRCV